MRLVRVEMRRALRRRAVWVLIGVALIGIGVAGVAVWLDSADHVTTQPGADPNAAVMYDWWRPGDHDGVLLIGATFLMLGALIGGATVSGAEWRAGTMTTVLTWEPRRPRLLLARLTASAILAFVIALGLEAAFFLAFVPSVVAHGSIAGTDAAWWGSLFLAGLRVSSLAALAALLGGVVANLARNATGAIIAVWAWLAVGENLVRNLKPGWAPRLMGENLAVILTWSPLEGTASSTPFVAVLTVASVLGLLGAVTMAMVQRLDVSGAS